MSDLFEPVEWAESALTVGDIIDKLSEYPRDLHVVMSRDSEGNGYSPLAYVDTVIYRPETTWSGEVMSYMADVAYNYGDQPELLKGTAFEGATEENMDGIPLEEANAISLWPIN